MEQKRRLQFEYACTVGRNRHVHGSSNAQYLGQSSDWGAGEMERYEKAARLPQVAAVQRDDGPLGAVDEVPRICGRRECLGAAADAPIKARAWLSPLRCGRPARVPAGRCPHVRRRPPPLSPPTCLPPARAMGEAPIFGIRGDNFRTSTRRQAACNVRVLPPADRVACRRRPAQHAHVSSDGTTKPPDEDDLTAL